MQQLQLLKQAKFLSNKSQSIFELLIAISIFLIAFISLITLVNSYLNALKTVKERTIANFLAQEGLELVIAKRNIERINNQDFNNIFQTGTYCIDYNLDLTQNPSECILYMNQEGFYTHTQTATPTIFSRLLKIDNNGNYAVVTSTVKFYNQSVELTTILTPWF